MWPRVPIDYHERVRRRFGALERFFLSKHFRYCCVSAIGVLVAQVVLVLLVHGAGLSEGWSNIVAVSCACVPSYTLSRRWIWRIEVPGDVWLLAVPFWAVTLLSLAVSTVVVHWLAETWDNPLAANVGNIATFGGLWVARFLLLDRLLFSPLTEATRTHGPKARPERDQLMPPPGEDSSRGLRARCRGLAHQREATGSRTRLNRSKND